MSRSRREPIIKDRPKNEKKSTFYWRTVRRVINDAVRMLKYEPESDETLPEPKEIVNDYDYCDYVIDLRTEDEHKSYYFKDAKNKAKRK
jgi:hypothetical protein